MTGGTDGIRVLINWRRNIMPWIASPFRRKVGSHRAEWLKVQHVNANAMPPG
ncbi:hypothetical protein [Myxosarcina sp. GI1]|uniref:hypothetical protein n=1 Tax=Myxosarcina sp. GI1 TaxID=1541065 RepID=UPI0012E09531|nr:hypothetical protein [Myxosarcina sp. GI1]